MLNLAVAWTVTLLAGGDASPARVSFPTSDGGVVSADLYGKGERGVVLAHGGRFTRESWRPQALGLLEAGFQALAIDFRGHGESHGPSTPAGGEGFHLDVLAAVRYLREAGTRTVSVVGGSFGGGAAARAAVEAPGEINRLVLLAHSAIEQPERMSLEGAGASRQEGK